MDEQPQDDDPRNGARYLLVFVALALGGIGLYFRAISFGGLDASAALYIGLPLLLVFALIFTPPAQSATGAGLKGLTILLLFSAPILNEGFICIIMASPILYSVVALGGWLIDRSRKKEHERDVFKLAAFSVVMGVLALEGTTDATSFNRTHTVSVTETISAPIVAVRAQLGQTPTFDNKLNGIGRIFPLPTQASGTGLNVGDTRTLDFTYYKWIVANPHHGRTVFEITESSDTNVSFAIPEDTSYLSTYLTWQSSNVALVDMGDETKVTWTLTYHRKLDPIWYFGPMQRFVVNQTAHELIDSLATPQL